VISLQANDFELFDVPVQYAQDRAQLDARWKALQREAHPDRFAAEGAAAQRIAMQWSVRINEAYQRLKDPLKRAAYLCELQGAPVQAENNTAMPPAFLMQQMEWRESLDDTNSAETLQALAGVVAEEQRHIQQTLGDLLDVAKDPAQAVGQVRALMFIERFTQEVNAKLDRLN
jgi:molecular chaperone HscB